MREERRRSNHMDQLHPTASRRSPGEGKQESPRSHTIADYYDAHDWQALAGQSSCEVSNVSDEGATPRKVDVGHVCGIVCFYTLRILYTLYCTW